MEMNENERLKSAYNYARDAGYADGFIDGYKAGTKEISDIRVDKWEDEGWYADEYPHHVYSCPACAKTFIKCPDEIEEFKYCPNCGTKKEGVR
jgi:hypothetical protein